MKSFTANFPDSLATPTVTWDYVRANTGTYRPLGSLAVRLVTVPQEGGTGGFVTLYVSTRLIQIAQDRMWKDSGKFVETDENVTISFTE